MIQAVTTPQQQAEYCRRIAGKPYFASVLGTHLRIVRRAPGQRVDVLPAARHGGAGTARRQRRCCAVACPTARTHARNCRASCDSCTSTACGANTRWPAAYGNTWQSGKPLTLWTLPQGRALPLPKPPARKWGLTLDTAPSMLPISRLVFSESDAEADEFYSTACTALAHGYGTCRGPAVRWQARLHGRLL